MQKKGSTSSFLQEELMTRLAIQERSLKTFVKEIYENINQVLVLVKLQLAAIDLHNQTGSKQVLKESSELVGQAINDLRRLAKQLSPDEIIRQGFAHAITMELDRLRLIGMVDGVCRSKGDYYQLDPAKELILFLTIQGLISKLIVADTITRLRIEVSYLQKAIQINIKFKGSGEKDIDAIIGKIMRENKFQKRGKVVTAGKGSGNAHGFFNLLIKRN
jgi:signal transduction histidine kinase